MPFLRVARIQANTTQQQLAEAAGISQTAISKIEKGQFLPTGDVRERIDKFLGVGVDWMGMRLQEEKTLGCGPWEEKSTPEDNLLRALYIYFKSAQRPELPYRTRFALRSTRWFAMRMRKEIRKEENV